MAAASHFDDVCRLVGHPPPHVADPKSEFFTREMSTEKTGGQRGRAYVYYQGRVCVWAEVVNGIITLEQIEELDYIHTALDTAVLDAYGWPHTLTDEQILEQLLALNLERVVTGEQSGEELQRS